MNLYSQLRLSLTFIENGSLTPDACLATYFPIAAHPCRTRMYHCYQAGFETRSHI